MVTEEFRAAAAGGPSGPSEHRHVLRRERAELRSPGRLSEQAAALGMGPAKQTNFVSVAPEEVAIVQRTGAASMQHSATPIQQEFEQYAKVKQQALVAP